MTSIQQRLRGGATTLRIKSMPLKHLIPLLSQSADHIDKVESEVAALKEERDKLLLIIKKVAAWNRSYPSSRIYGYGGIKKIAAEMDAIYVEACAAIARAEGRTE